MFDCIYDVMVGLDDCGRSIFGVMESFDPSCFSWVSLLLADDFFFRSMKTWRLFLLTTANDILGFWKHRKREPSLPSNRGRLWFLLVLLLP